MTFTRIVGSNSWFIQMEVKWDVLSPFSQDDSVLFRVVIITVFHSYLPFTVKPKSVYRFTVTRKTNDQNMNYFFPSQLFTPFSTGNSVV